MIQVFSVKKTNRLDYTCEVLFKHILKCDYKIICAKNDLDFNFPVLNYSEEKISDTLQIIPTELLFNDNIKKYTIEVEEDYYFFKTSSNNLIRFDLLASSFYMLSRYEEYLPFESDLHDRFNAEDSLAYKNDFLKKAVVNRWAMKIKSHIQEIYPGYNFPNLEYNYISSFDIDIAYAYKNKGIIRLVGGGVKSLMKGDFEDLYKRIQYVLGLKSDPFDVYTYIFDSLDKYNLKSLFFFLTGELGEYDKNISLEKFKYQELIEGVSNKTNIGIHPSYGSNKSFAILKKEIENFRTKLNVEVVKSRQHYLKLSFPETYINLIKLGIKEDYTMGYASQIGFRAGICTPFPFFDLKKNLPTELMIHPFQVMDGTLNQYLKFTPDEALKEVEVICHEVKYVEGTFVTLWHNESLSEFRQWKGWKIVFEQMIGSVKK